MRHIVRLAATLAVAAASAGPVSAQTTTLKMQATWPASLTLYENFTYFVERVGKMSGGQLKIDAMPAGQVVPAKRFMFPPYSFAANYYFPEKKEAAAKQK